MNDYIHHELISLGEDETPYRQLTTDYVSTGSFEGNEILKVETEGLVMLANQAIRDSAHMLRPGHLVQLRNILDDPEASDNDRFVAIEMLKNANIAAGGILPMCQDTGTAIVMGKKGHCVWTEGDDEAALSQGIMKAYAGNKPAIQSAGPDRYVPGSQHPEQPACPNRDILGSRNGLQANVHLQRRRLGQQELSVPGDPGASQPGPAG